MSHREVGSGSIQGTSPEASQGQGHGEACAVGVAPWSLASLLDQPDWAGQGRWGRRAVLCSPRDNRRWA